MSLLYAIQAQRRRMDADAVNYLATVEAADGQALEASVRKAYDDFFKSCKDDNIWDAIKASCILAGARTLEGALVPLKGAAPTNFNFVSVDYARKTGLIGNGATKYLNTNRNNNADPQNSKHVAIHLSSVGSVGPNRSYFGGDAVSGSTQGIDATAGSRFSYRVNSAAGSSPTNTPPSVGFLGINRSSSSTTSFRNNGVTINQSISSGTPTNFNILLFRRTSSIDPAYHNARISYYSIGESVDLLKLDARVSEFMSAINTAIP